MISLTPRAAALRGSTPLVLAAGVAGLLVAVACSRNLQPPAAQGEQQERAQSQAVAPATVTGSVHSAAGVRWRAPASWEISPERAMRVVTYRISAAGGDAEGAECGVFFFGSGQGGDVESNIARWQAQFQPEDGRPAGTDAARAERTVRGLVVTTVDINGTYLFSPSPMSPQKTPKAGYRMLGAIVAAPAGNVFFKLTGPAATVAANRDHFKALLDSLERE